MLIYHQYVKTYEDFLLLTMIWVNEEETQKSSYFTVKFNFGQKKLIYSSMFWPPNGMWLLRRCIFEIKCALSINYKKPKKEKFRYLYKSDSKTENQSFIFYALYNSNGSNQQKIVLLCCVDSLWWSHRHYKFWWHHVEGY